MSIRNVFLLTAVSIAALFITACNDDDDPSFTEADLTISSGWHLDAMDTNMDEVVVDIVNNIDTLSQSEKDQAIQIVEAIATDIETVEDCESDDTYIFAQSGDLMYEAGNIDCPGGGDDAFLVLPATWEMEGETLIITDGDGETNEAEIKTLNENEFVFELRENASEYYDVGTDVYFTIEVSMVPAE